MLRCEDQVEDILGTQWTMRQVLVWLEFNDDGWSHDCVRNPTKTSPGAAKDVYKFFLIYIYVYI